MDNQNISTHKYVPDEHYDTIMEWWASYGKKGACIPKSCLPNTGIVAKYKGSLAAAVFIYTTNSDIVQIQFPVANRRIDNIQRVNSLKAAIEEAVRFARGLMRGKGILWGCTDSAIIARIYGNNGFECGEEGDTFFLNIGNLDDNFLK